MIKVDELRGAIAKNGYSQKDVASMIGGDTENIL